MREEEFWAIIGLLDWRKKGDDDAVLAPAAKALSERSVQDIASFQEILSRKLYEIDTISHARNIGANAYADDDRFFSPDHFLYARCCVVANGYEFYRTVCSNPSRFPKDREFERLLELAIKAYEIKTGTQDFDFAPSVNYETFSNQAGWN